MEKFNTLFLILKTYLIKFYDILLIIMTAILIGLILYNRIRPRIPKDLPITLSIDNINLYVYTISVFCLLIVFTLYNIFYKPKISMFTPISNYINDRLLYIYTLLHNLFINCFSIDFETYILFLTEKIIYYFKYSSLFYIITNIIPRFLVISIFILDIFYFNKIHYFYISLALLLIPLFTRLYIYSLKQYITRNLDEIKDYIQILCLELNTDPDFILVIDLNLIFEQLILYKLKKRENPLEFNIYPMPSLKKIIAKKFNINIETFNIDFDEITLFYKQRLSELADLASFYTAFDNTKKALQQYMSLLISIIYLFTWLYVIYFSNNDLPEDYFTFLYKIYPIEDPFSGVYLSLASLISHKSMYNIKKIYFSNFKFITIKRFTGTAKTATNLSLKGVGNIPKPGIDILKALKIAVTITIIIYVIIKNWDIIRDFLFDTDIRSLQLPKNANP